ncbi:MAG: hypothetical protein KGL75_05740, partial [Acidobacteriota bacterium]|nr:hypothetical protein [Acidobacteriota bacterium]
MIRKAAMAISISVLAPVFFSSAARAQAPAAPADQTCTPTAAQVEQQMQAFARRFAEAGSRSNQPATRNANVTAIQGVVAAGAQWAKIWQQGGNSADGILATNDGSVLVAQEDYDKVLKIDSQGNASVFVTGAKGIGALS